NSANNQIGGIQPGQRNVITGNREDGVHIFGASSSGNQIQGNYLGLAASGLSRVAEAIGNGGAGVNIDSSPGNVIGGSAAAPGTDAGNVISGNTASGIVMTNVTGGHI